MKADVGDRARRVAALPRQILEVRLVHVDEPDAEFAQERERFVRLPFPVTEFDDERRVRPSFRAASRGRTRRVVRPKRRRKLRERTGEFAGIEQRREILAEEHDVIVHVARAEFGKCVPALGSFAVNRKPAGVRLAIDSNVAASARGNTSRRSRPSRTAARTRRASRPISSRADRPDRPNPYTSIRTFRCGPWEA